MNVPATIARIDAAGLRDGLTEFAELIHDCVHAGASIGFVLPFGIDEAERYWTDKVLPSVAAGKLVLLVARVEDRIAGTVQLDQDTPPNQPHRAEVRKLLVHPRFRRGGIARALMAELEASATGLSRRLLTLDTRTGDVAEPLYASLGFATAGIIPSYCRDPREAAKLDSTTIMYKALG